MHDESHRAKILIVDDNATDRFLLQAILKKQGHEVIAAGDGVEAIAAYRRERPKIVLLDVLMPNMDGFEAAQEIKRLAGDAFVPVIFLTSLQEADSLARCLDVGGDDFISKPYNSVILQAKINAFSRMVEMHQTVLRQRDEIVANNQRLLREQEVAKRVFDKVAHAGCLDAPNIKFSLSPIAVFNGDVALAGVGPSGNLLVLLGDFTGHGLSAAIGAMPLAQSFYSMLEKGFAIRDIVREINVKLHSILPVGVFCCAFVAEFDFKAQALQVWNGGMPDGVIYRPQDRKFVRLQSRHLPLGVRGDEDFKSRVETYEVQPGDRLCFWSDGIIEAEGDNGEMYGERRLFDVLERNEDPNHLFAEINLSVNCFIGEGALNDDISIIEVEVVKPEEFSVSVPEYVADRGTGPRDWSLGYTLRADTLRDFDPLPLMLNILMQVPFLRPVAGQIYTVMSELYSNALEHGLLKLDSALKDSPQGFSEYYRLRSERLRQLQEGEVTISLHYCGDARGGLLYIDIEDSGEGFDHRRWLSEIERRFENESGDYSGRGIMLLYSLCESVSYSGAGNQVRATFRWGEVVDSAEDIV